MLVTLASWFTYQYPFYVFLYRRPKSQVRIRRFVAGCTAGSVSVTFTYPLDLVRARMAITERVK